MSGTLRHCRISGQTRLRLLCYAHREALENPDLEVGFPAQTRALEAATCAAYMRVRNFLARALQEFRSSAAAALFRLDNVAGAAKDPFRNANAMGLRRSIQAF
jgi:hypothetical protein